MEELKKKYYEEASQLINDLEDAFLRVSEIGHENTINTVFRAVHSLKGGASIFGFDAVTEFSHHLENLFSNLRNNYSEVSAEIISLGLTASDILRKLLDNEIDDVLNAKIEEIRTQITYLIGNSDQIKQEKTEMALAQFKLYSIDFAPKTNLFANGTNPLFILEEISSLGKSDVIYRLNLPSKENYHYEECYSAWHIFLLSTADIENIQDIFLFVVDEHTVEIEEFKISDQFNFKKFTQLIKQQSNTDDIIEHDIIQKAIDDASSIKKIKKEDLEKKLSNFSKANKITSVRVDNEKIDALLNIMSEIVIQQASLNLFSVELKDANLVKITARLDALTKQLRETVFDISLIPFSETISRFKRLIFELSQVTGKEINFKVSGEQIELDKNLIETIIDPLIHLIRNCVDHGIEMPQERIAQGKSSEGLLSLDIQQRGEDIILVLSDDGRGMDLDKIRQRAIQKELITQESKVSKEELLQFVFLPGFSTAENVTEISGRGVGMDVVRQNIEVLRGSIRLSTEKGKGTEFLIHLPVTVSIQDGFIFSVGQTKFILPAQQVINFSSLSKKQLNEIYKNLIDYNGKEIQVYHIGDELKIESSIVDVQYMLILQKEEREIAIIVDQIFNKQQFVIKPIGMYYKNLYFLTGATILGNGEIALIIDSARLLDFLKNKAERK
jgi:two-component system chemotaxis sensor kinase CheA